jgi:hypothetical protein
MRVIVVLVLLGLLTRCGDASSTQSGDPGTVAPSGVADSQTVATGHEPIQTDSVFYALRPDGPGWATTIGFSYRNSDSDTVYVVNCNGAILMNLQKRVAGEWIDSWYAEGNDCLSPPVVIPPGEVFRGEIAVWGGEPGNSSFNTFRLTPIDGEYRLLWHRPVYHYNPRQGSFGDTLPLEGRVSNPFTLNQRVAQ